MNMKTRIELSIMMFLQFFIWGAWAVTLGTYLDKGLGFKGTEIANAYSTTAWAAIISPFFVGMVADRFFSAQKVLGVMHLLGAVLMFWAAKVTDPIMFFCVLLAYALCYMPTLALTNAIALNHMKDPEKEFPAIRVLGTIGWIVAGLTISYVLDRAFKDVQVETTSMPLQMAAIASALLGVYSFFLPNTPPQGAGKKVTVGDILGLDALRLLKNPSFTVFILSSLLICIPLAFYYTFTNPFLNESGVSDVAGKMTMGQMSEVGFMLVMPFFFKRLGVKKMLLAGMAAWAVRYFLFAYGNNSSMVWMFYTGILLHGICYDFFFVTGQIYVDNVAPAEVRASAQGLIALVTYGVGMAIGNNLIAGRVVDAFATETGHNWRSIWLVPGIMAIVILVLFAISFRDNSGCKQADNA